MTQLAPAPDVAPTQGEDADQPILEARHLTKQYPMPGETVEAVRASRWP